MSQASFRLVFLDAGTFGDISFNRFTSQWNCTIHTKSTPIKVPRRIKGHQVVIINKVVLDRSLLESPEARDLKLIAVAATGTDNVDLQVAQAHGITVCNVPTYATRSVAQFTMALILELATRVNRYGELVRVGAWEKSPIFTLLDFPSIELEGKTLGIIGYGNIGQAVAKMARCLGLKVLIAARPGSSGSIPAGRLFLYELLRRADFVTLHCPLTPQTSNLIDKGALALMKPTAFLINTARGGLLDGAALIQALRDKRLAGAALDVLPKEPPSPGHPVIQAAKELNNLIVTPHCAWSTCEARQRLLNEVAENILAFTRGQDRNCCVQVRNVPEH
ncbi:MAG: D-2-hydroxyacid dehydrogenase [Candidatus Binatia bacterium]